jgi:hypothetical protein
MLLSDLMCDRKGEWHDERKAICYLRSAAEKNASVPNGKCIGDICSR